MVQKVSSVLPLLLFGAQAPRVNNTSMRAKHLATKSLSHASGRSSFLGREAAVMSFAEFQEKLARPTLLFKPQVSHQSVQEPEPVGSSFGTITHGSADEEWPSWQQRKLWPVLQLNLSGTPFRPKGLEDVAFLTLFADPDQISAGDEMGTTWELRCYRSLHSLKPLAPPDTHSPMKPINLDHPVLAEDYPTLEVQNLGLSQSTWEQFRNQHPTQAGIKVGGWPQIDHPEELSLLCKDHPAKPRFLIQVCCAEPNWGRAYLSRGTSAGYKNTWYFDWCKP